MNLDVVSVVENYGKITSKIRVFCCCVLFCFKLVDCFLLEKWESVKAL